MSCTQDYVIIFAEIDVVVNNCGKLFRSYTLRLFIWFISHGFIPQKMFSGELRSSVKNKVVNKTASDNYWPIMISAIILKLFEYYWFPFVAAF